MEVYFLSGSLWRETALGLWAPSMAWLWSLEGQQLPSRMSSLWEPALLSRDRNPTGTSQNFWRQEFKSCLGAKKTKSLWAIQRTKADIGKWSIAFPGPSCYCALPSPQLSTPTGADQRPLDVGGPEAGGLLGLRGHTYGTRAEIRQDTGSACVSRLWNPQHTASCLHERCESQCPGENDSLSLEESTDVKHEAGVGSVASQESRPTCTHTPATHIVSNPNPVQKTACLFGIALSFLLCLPGSSESTLWPNLENCAAPYTVPICVCSFLLLRFLNSACIFLGLLIF